jgi:hypothetical protein
VFVQDSSSVAAVSAADNTANNKLDRTSSGTTVASKGTARATVQLRVKIRRSVVADSFRPTPTTSRLRVPEHCLDFYPDTLCVVRNS